MPSGSPGTSLRVVSRPEVPASYCRWTWRTERTENRKIRSRVREERQQMRRRTFVSISACATAWPFVANGQPVPPVIGILVAGTPDPTLFLKEFTDELSRLGYVDKKNVILELRSAGSTSGDRLRSTAMELVGLHPRVIVCYQTPTA